MSLTWRHAERDKQNKGDSQQLLNKGIQLSPRASNNLRLKLVAVSIPTPGKLTQVQSHQTRQNRPNVLGARDPYSGNLSLHKR